MANKRIRCQYSQDSRSLGEQEFLEALLLSDVSYPWNPADPESEVYLSALEQSLGFDEWSADEVRSRSQTLYAQMDRLWDVAEAAAKSRVEKGAIAELRESLQQRFSAYVPDAATSAIAERALDLLGANLSLAEQLVGCVRSLLPDWAEDDLHVLARPLAYAMRGIESPPANVPQVSWTELSEIDRARLSLAIAHYALTKLQTYDS